ncbi:MAG: hypothetical protein MK105_11965 [Crocinitomicaceae bacterium]|nr:hypothetical protein [Crocinitomicaceae bacterium]
MKNLIIGLLAIAGSLVSLQSCKEEIDLIGDFKETAVVYAILDQAEETHMIKVTRAFIGPGNSYTHAQVPDSNYFDNVTGTVTELNNGVPTGQSWDLMDTTVFNKDSNGAFYGPEQELLYFKSAPILNQFNGDTIAFLNEDYEYRLDLTINDGLFTVSGVTELVKEMDESISSNNFPFKYANNQGELQSSPITINDVKNAEKVEVNLTVEYTEWIGAIPTVKSYSYKIGDSDCLQNSSVVFSPNGETFFENLTENISNDPAITKRTFNSITTVFTSADQNLSEYINNNKPSSDLAQATPPIEPNLEATAGYRVVGIYAARVTKTVYKPFINPLNQLWRCIDKSTTRYLCNQAGIGFCSNHVADNAESWYCP